MSEPIVFAGYALAAALLLGCVLCWLFSDQSTERLLLKYKQAKYLPSTHSGPSAPAERRIESFYNDLLPLVFRDGRWYEIFTARLRTEHSLLCWLWAPKMRGKQQNSQQLLWMEFASKLVFIMSTGTIFVYLAYADDGRCEDIEQAADCQNARSLLARPCAWDTSTATAPVCVFEEPVLSFVFLLVATVMVLAVTALLVGAVGVLSEHIHKSQSPFRTSTVVPVDETEGYDEFMDCQTIKSTWFRGARLEKQRLLMDDVTPMEEAFSLAKIMSTARHADETHEFFLKELRAQVVAVRKEAMALKRILEGHVSVAERESYLFRVFIAHYFSGADHRMVLECFTPSYLHAASGDSRWMVLACSLWLTLVLGNFAVIYFLGKEIGSESLRMWIAILVLAALEEILVLEPFSVWFRDVCLAGTVSAQVRHLCATMLARSRFILMRTRGQMDHANDLVQYFNPAARVARMFPAWHISRLLLSVNDSDIPHEQAASEWCWPYHAVFAIMKVLVFSRPCGRIALSWIVLAMANGAALGLFVLGQVNLFAAWGIVAVLFLTPCIVEYYHRRVVAEEQAKEDKRRSDKAFTKKSLLAVAMEEQAKSKGQYSRPKLLSVVDVMAGKQHEPIKRRMDVEAPPVPAPARVPVPFQLPARPPLSRQHSRSDAPSALTSPDHSIYQPSLTSYQQPAPAAAAEGRGYFDESSLQALYQSHHMSVHSAGPVQLPPIHRAASMEPVVHPPIRPQSGQPVHTLPHVQSMPYQQKPMSRPQSKQRAPSAGARGYGYVDPVAHAPHIEELPHPLDAGSLTGSITGSVSEMSSVQHSVTFTRFPSASRRAVRGREEQERLDREYGNPHDMVRLGSQMARQQQGMVFQQPAPVPMPAVYGMSSGKRGTGTREMSRPGSRSGEDERTR